ncbi:MAG TPA: fibronectin type III domain-containing protein [Acidimicrobiales bacterium]|jgi:hypothetical protein|nr:fibronectin type III domain-containing protein [Acidimicrobiales bacterium]
MRRLLTPTPSDKQAGASDLRRRPVRALGAALVAVVVSGGFAVSTVAAAPAQPAPSGGFHTHTGSNGESDVNVCSDAVPAGQASCLARVRTDPGAQTRHPLMGHDAGPAALLGDNGGYSPSYLQSAYDTPSATAGAGVTVAVIDAYDYPSAESDLAYFRSFFNLPACTSATGCFRKVGETGGSSLPTADYVWAQETSLDLDMVSAICPLCKILLVEANSASLADLGASVNTAVSLGAAAVSNSYGGAEFSGETAYDQYYNHPGVAIVASSGDNGYGADYPSSSPYVTAAGGTSLVQNTNTGTRNGTETAWAGSGSGCSAYEPKPSWQHDTGCTSRTSTDVSADADPGAGVWSYDTYQIPGWRIMGGTSAASPMIAAVYALAAPAPASATVASFPYAHTSSLNDVTSGSNGTCSVSYVCTAGAGYDGPTGLGTPNGTTAFTSSGGGSQPPPAAPSAPVNVTASGGQGSVALSWSPPAATSGLAVSYSVYRGAASGGESTLSLASGVTATSYTDRSVTAGTTYYYKVVATTSAGSSAPSNEASAIPSAAVAVPGAPVLSAQSSASKGVTLTWTAATSGGAATGFTVYRAKSSGGETTYTTVTCTTGTCTYNDTTAKRATTFYYEVAGTNPAGTGAMSNEASAKAS